MAAAAAATDRHRRRHRRAGPGGESVWCGRRRIPTPVRAPELDTRRRERRGSKRPANHTTSAMNETIEGLLLFSIRQLLDLLLS